MSFVTVVFTALGLSMDAFAVSVTSGMMMGEQRVKNALRVAVWFGFFQGVMPLIGWLAGIKLQNYIIHIDHWIALFLLGFIGTKMIYETLKPEGNEDDADMDVKAKLSDRTLFLLAVATSIDALAVGVGFAFLRVALVQSVTVIGLITFVLCFVGVLIGKKCGHLLKRNAELLGGIVLILIGIKIFVEHTNIISTIKFLK